MMQVATILGRGIARENAKALQIDIYQDRKFIPKTGRSRKIGYLLRSEIIAKQQSGREFIPIRFHKFINLKVRRNYIDTIFMIDTS